MIPIKFEVEEEETPLPIESENERIKRILSLKFFGNNLNNSTSDNTNNGNNNNVCGTFKQKSLPELNGVVPKKVVPKKKKQLDNSTTDFVVVCSKSIKTEPVESSLSLTTQLNNSLNIQSLLRQNRIQNGWTTNEQSIPIGTQQQQQSIFSTKIEPIVYGNHQEVPLSLDQCSSSIPNLNPNSEKTTTVTNCVTTMENSGLRAGFGRSAKLNVCYSMPKETNQFTTTTIQNNFDAINLESTNNDDNYSDQDYTFSGSGSISGVDPSASTGPSPLPEAAVPLLVGKKPLLPVPPLTLEEKKERHREYSRIWYLRKKANPKIEQPLDPKVRAEKLRRNREYNRKRRQQLLATGTPEQRELIRMKQLEYVRRHMEKETEEQRKRRLEQKRHYNRTVAKQRLEQKRLNLDTGREGKMKREANQKSCRWKQIGI